MVSINFINGVHNIQWVSTSEQDAAIEKYKHPLKKALAEIQTAKYRKDPDKYRSLELVSSLLDQGIYHPYLGAIGGGDTYIMRKLDDAEQKYAVQYKYLDAQPIWLSEPLGIKADGVYRVTPTSLGYIVKYEVDISNYESW